MAVLMFVGIDAAIKAANLGSRKRILRDAATREIGAEDLAGAEARIWNREL
jgi:hypothetical protein